MRGESTVIQARIKQRTDMLVRLSMFPDLRWKSYFPPPTLNLDGRTTILAPLRWRNRLGLRGEKRPAGADRRVSAGGRASVALPMINVCSSSATVTCPSLRSRRVLTCFSTTARKASSVMPQYPSSVRCTPWADGSCARLARLLNSFSLRQWPCSGVAQWQSVRLLIEWS